MVAKYTSNRPADRARESKFEDPAHVRVFAGYETTPGYGWYVVYLIWGLEDSVGVDSRQNSHAVSRCQLAPFCFKLIDRGEEGIVFTLKAAYERVNATL